MKRRRLLDLLALVGVATVVVGVVCLIAHQVRVSWAVRSLPDAMARAQDRPCSDPAFRRAMVAARLVAGRPSERSDRVMAAALHAAKMDATRACVQLDTEMALVPGLARRAAGGSAPAREACLQYLTDSAEFVAAWATDDPSLCATVVPQQQLILEALCALDDPSGLPAVRKLVCHCVPIVAIDAAAYIGRFGEPDDIVVLSKARERMQKVAPHEVVHLVLISCDRATSSIETRSEPPRNVAADSLSH